METLEKPYVKPETTFNNTNSEKSFSNEKRQIKRVTYTAGIYTSVGLIIYFVAMRGLGLHHRIEFHYFNIVLLFLGLRYAIKNIIKITGEIKYFEGLKAGVIVSVISILIFNIFMFIYETVIDPPFLDFLKEKISLGHMFSDQETILDVMWLLTVEGLSSGFIMTYILMQYYKDDHSLSK